MPQTQRCLLVVLDGWGLRAERDSNAILLAGTPNMDRLAAEFPHARLMTSGLAVGLPEGQMGNSEVGHTNLGAGRIVYQDLVRINRAIEDGSLRANEVLCAAMDAAKASGRRLHLLGLLSDGGVHSLDRHALALVEMARDRGVRDVVIHAFTDGRDTPPSSGRGFVEAAEVKCRSLSVNGFRARLGSVSGRYYAMDRDNRWDRVARAYAALVRGEGHRGASGLALVEAAYGRGETDEFIAPGVVADAAGPVGRIEDGDAVVFFNFRSDRARELTRALALGGFDGFDRGPQLRLSAYACMTQYDATFGLPVAFAPDEPTDIFPELLARRGLKQFRCAETEKYAHVTFFFNGGREATLAGETRELVPSPRDVKTYDLKPEMSARAVTDAVLRALPHNDFVLVNLANADMVGHTGVLPAALEAVRVVDECIGRLWRECARLGTAMLVTADHGNIEQMVDPATGEPHTAHTLNPVPFVVASQALRGARLRDGILADVSPTLCDVMGLEKSPRMSGRSLLVR
jgi:2,3-bisphosphoglycerate-independent phosphoglycerate mutase